MKVVSKTQNYFLNTVHMLQPSRDLSQLIVLLPAEGLHNQSYNISIKEIQARYICFYSKISILWYCAVLVNIHT